MDMSTDPELRNRIIASARQTVEVNAKIRSWYENAEDGHLFKSDEFGEMSLEGFERSIRTAMGYGYPVEAVAVTSVNERRRSELHR